MLERTAKLIGEDNCKKLSRSRVAIFGVGGVGSFATEALARAGVGTIAIFDPERVDHSNRNRQLVALTSTIGMPKVEVMKQRILDINPDCNVQAYQLYYGPDTKDQVDLSQFDHIIDAIDSVSSKILLVEQAKLAGTPIICAMGAGNKLDPTKFEVADIKKTSVCPLARVMRRELKLRDINSLKVVYSKEQPVSNPAPEGQRRAVVGSISFVPSVAGLIMAGEVVKYLIGKE